MGLSGSMVGGLVESLVNGLVELEDDPLGILVQASAAWVAGNQEPSGYALTELTALGVGNAVLGSTEGANANAPFNNLSQFESFGDHFALPGSSGNDVSLANPFGRALSRLEVIATIDMADVPPSGGAKTVMSVWTGAGSQRSWMFNINGSGNLVFTRSRDGSENVGLSSSAALSGTGLVWIKAIYDTSGTVDFLTSTDGIAFSALGTQADFGTTGDLFSSTAPLGVGSINAGTAQLYDGLVQSASAGEYSAEAVLDASFSLQETATDQAYSREVLMSSLPSVTVGSAGGASVIASSVLVGKDDATFTILGADTAQAGESTPNDEFNIRSSLTSANSVSEFIVEFDYDGSEFELKLKGTGGKVRIEVDGEFSTETQDFTLASDGMIYLAHYDLSTSSARTIRIHGWGMYFGGIRREAAAAITTTGLTRKRVIVIGDSFTEGNSGIGFGYRGFTWQLGRLKPGWDVWPSGSGATGYTTDGAISGRYKFADRIVEGGIDDLIQYAPDVVIVAGGINDQSNEVATPGITGTEATAVLATIRAALPSSDIVTIGPFWPNNSANATRDSINSQILSAGIVFEAKHIDAKPWIDDQSEVWVTGGDATHPTVEGHEFLAQRIAAEIDSLGLANNTTTTLSGGSWSVSRSTSGAKTSLSTLPLLQADASAPGYLEVADDALLDVGSSQDFTAPAMARVFGTPSASSVLLSKKADLTTGAGYVVYLDTSRRPVGVIADGATAYTITGTALDEGVMTLVALQRSGTDIQLVQIGSSTISATPVSASAADLSNALAFRVGALSTGLSPIDAEVIAMAPFPSALTSSELGQARSKLLQFNGGRLAET